MNACWLATFTHHSIDRTATESCYWLLLSVSPMWIHPQHERDHSVWCKIYNKLRKKSVSRWKEKYSVHLLVAWRISFGEIYSREEKHFTISWVYHWTVSLSSVPRIYVCQHRRMKQWERRNFFDVLSTHSLRLIHKYLIKIRTRRVFADSFEAVTDTSPMLTKKLHHL